jgi:hypothetical protein
LERQGVDVLDAGDVVAGSTSLTVLRPANLMARGGGFDERALTDAFDTGDQLVIQGTRCNTATHRLARFLA